MVVQGQMAFEESGVNPLETDPEGFRARCARRIRQGRVWVWIEGDRLVFKADVISDTPEVIYVEGVWVAPEERGRGYGTRCLSQLSRDLLSRAGAVTLLVNEKNPGAIAFYRRAGYRACCHYDTVYLSTSH
jgi:predicted GNAT family acetyltransferase